jgi:glucan endo-1,3-alpha-glucosidase
LLDKTAKLLRHPAYMLFKGRSLLSTFGGERADFGGWGWEGWLERLNQELGEEVDLSFWMRTMADSQVFFMPGFFLPPDNVNALKHVDGMFNWNSAW